jgi:hypothetical protein
MKYDVWRRVQGALRREKCGKKIGNGVIGYSYWGMVHVNVDWRWMERGAREKSWKRGGKDPGCVNRKFIQEGLDNVSRSSLKWFADTGIKNRG